jgi:hypothetical protein
VSAPRAGRTVNQPRGLDEKEGERVCCRNASTGGKAERAPRQEPTSTRGWVFTPTPCSQYADLELGVCLKLTLHPRFSHTPVQSVNA